MLEQQSRNNSTTQHKSLDDLNVLGLWSVSGSDWSSLIKEECLAATHSAVEEEKSSFTRTAVLFAALTSLTLLSGAIWVVASEISQAMQNVSSISVEQLILKD